MGYHLTEPYRVPAQVAAKNSVMGFRIEIGIIVRKSAPQPVDSHREKYPTATRTVSGIPYWLSRDPIGEEGGLNLYGFVGNDGVNRWDYLGLEGSFEVKHVPVPVGTSQQIQADGAESLDGFEVSYIEPEEGSSCECTIILAQAISNDGFTIGTDPHFDNFDKKCRDKSKKTDGGLAPPDYRDGGRGGQGTISLKDAPYIKKDADITSYVEVCALCVEDEQDKRTTYTVLGCVRFDFSHINAANKYIQIA